jgi:carboxyl-terminal processing protease
MENNNRKNIFIWALVVLALIIITNLATYHYSRNAAEGENDNSTTIIRYEPTRSDIDPDTVIIFEALDSILNNYYTPVEKEVLIEGAVLGIIQSLDDPLVRYYDAEDLEEFLMETRGSYGGIGVRIIESNQSIVVFDVFPGTPAERSGLSPGDRIIKADGVELTGQGLMIAVEHLRGPSDTTVELEIRRPGADEPIVINVSREEIQVTTVFSEMLDDGLGYIQISSFDSNTAREFTEQFRAMEQRGLSTGLILDLRNNPGGLVDQAVEIGKLLVPEGEIVRLVGRDDDVKTIYNSSAARKPYPIVVLINEESASASELLAGALQDRGAGMLVGKTSYGKASVQQLVYLPGDNAILLTMARYLTPSGHDIDKHGIEPDFTVEMPEVLRYYRYFHPGRLEEGSYGPDVEILQMILEQIGIRVEVSGYFDDQTARALSEFQIYANLRPSGEFDDQTWIELREALDIAARDQDAQLNYAIELINKPGLWTITGGIE